MKNKLFTHVDLDGIGCAIVGKLTFEDEIDIEYVNYNDVNERVSQFLTSGEVNNYDFIFITDISVNEEIAEMIEASWSSNLNLFDHHQTAMFLNKYSWCEVELTHLEMKTSGTYLFCRYLINAGLLIPSNSLVEFVEFVRSYDTWDWKQHGDQIAKDLNDIFWLIGRDDFVEVYTERLDRIDEYFSFTNIHCELLKYKRIEIDNYIERKLKSVKIFTDNENNKVAMVFADSNISELGNKICETYDEIDYCCIYTGTTVSLRSVGDFDVSQIAKEFGGGGHKNAAGISDPQDYITKYFLNLFF